MVCKQKALQIAVATTLDLEKKNKTKNNQVYSKQKITMKLFNLRLYRNAYTSAAWHYLKTWQILPYNILMK